MRKNRIGKGICPGAAWVIALAIAGCATSGAKVAKIHQNPQAYENKEIQITGQVTQVCQGMGCWIEVEQGGAKLIARSVDHKITPLRTDVEADFPVRQPAGLKSLPLRLRSNRRW